MRGVISRYSLIPVYSGCSVGSESQKKLGTSRILDAIDCQRWHEKLNGRLTEINIYPALEEATQDLNDLST
jgi:hypothetical protein